MDFDEYIDNKRMDTITKLNKAQDHRIKVLENVIENYSEGDLNEIFDIQNQIKCQDKRALNKAVNDLKKKLNRKSFC